MTVPALSPPAAAPGHAPARTEAAARARTSGGPGRDRGGRWTGLTVLAVGVAAAMLAHRLVDAVGLLTWAILFGVVAANARAIPDSARPTVDAATRRLLRAGIVLLGLSLSVGSIVALGLPLILLVVITLSTTLVVTTWLGRRLGLPGPQALLIGTGFAICGASAIAAMRENADADEDDVAVAVAMVTLFGSVMMVALPMLQGPLGLSDAQLGVWAGAGVQEVGQVVGAAGAAGATAVGVAVVVKLTRVLLLAPVVAGVSVVQRLRVRRAATSSDRASLPPVAPLFVVGFLACVALRSLGLVPDAALAPIAHVQDVALAAALFGMGTAVHLPSLVRSGGRAAVVATASTLLVGTLALAGAIALG
ncbi:putative integral membrane protein (TIGR00698 family) [Mumia flava]|uniref:Putative integral membrane protein (TIGR00698 family) n=1 Tax=Mumia flava TaxID=1348852 RepID=A0A2M9BGY4_9ACTN|nr:putative sulfate exporter family transporter [Mumia flava]PJJ57220.1 putative integral membrane protein (TIGR00698 family) [Mumia flava]